MTAYQRFLPVLACALCLSGCGDDNGGVTSPTPNSGPTSETFVSDVVVRGSAWRLVAVTRPGTLSATLTEASQPATVIGFGVGIRGGTGGGCLLNSGVTVPAGSAPQVDVEVDPGVYCVKIYDVGTLTDRLAFTIRIVYP